MIGDGIFIIMALIGAMVSVGAKYDPIVFPKQQTETRTESILSRRGIEQAIQTGDTGFACLSYDQARSYHYRGVQFGRRVEGNVCCNSFSDCVIK